jgi:hypothetical protein
VVDRISLSKRITRDGLRREPTWDLILHRSDERFGGLDPRTAGVL